MNPFDLMKNMKDLQSRMGEIQGRLKTMRAEGGAGGDLVKVTVDGTMDVVSVSIDPIAVDPRDVKMLEELVQAATNAATAKIREELRREMGEMAGGLPPGFLGT